MLQNSGDSLFTGAVPVEVLPVDVSDMAQYHEMKDIIEVEAPPDYLLIAAIVLSLIIVAVAGWYLFLRKKKTQMPALTPAPARSLFETAIEQIEKLEKENPPAPRFYARLDEICRTYIQNQLFVRAMQLTGDELMVQLNVYLPPDERTPFYQMLRLFSAVKFARYLPEESQKKATIESAKTGIQHIYYQLQRSLIQHAK